MNIRGVLRELGIPFREARESSHVSQGWIGIVCPMPGCGQGGKFGRGINLRSFRTTCWKCGPARLGTVLSLAAHKPLSAVLGLLPKLEQDPSDRAEVRPTGRYKPPVGVGPLQPAHRNYLWSRGFDPDEIAEYWQVQAIGDVPTQYAWRLFVPASEEDRPVSWTTRAIGRREPRYKAADPTDEDVPIHSVLYGSDLARHAIVIVEGPTDAWAVGPGAVATFGLSVTPAQVAKMAKYAVRAICFDNEPAAQRRARRLADQLSIFPGQTSVVQMSGPDPATSPKDEIKELRAAFLE